MGLQAKESVIEQLVSLKKKFAWRGETDDQLRRHFSSELEDKEIVWLEEGGKITAFCDWSWVDSVEDVVAAMQGKKTSGKVLFILNLICTKLKLIIEIKKKLPLHRWVIGEHDGNIHAPKGVPAGFLEEVIPVGSA